MTISFDASAAYYALNAHLQGTGTSRARPWRRVRRPAAMTTAGVTTSAAAPAARKPAPWLAITPMLAIPEA